MTNFTTSWTSCRYSQKRRFLKTVNFSTFWNSCRYSRNRPFFVLEYGKTHFPGLYCPRKTMEKWSFLDQNHELTPFQKVNFSTFWNTYRYSQKSFFFVLEYAKTHFPCIHCPKKTNGKMAIFGPKQWVNPFGKMSIFPPFELLACIAKKGVFPSRIW